MRKLYVILVFVLLLVNNLVSQIQDYNVVTPYRLELTKEYSKKHYNLDSYYLVNPQMVVIHYTVYPTIEEVLDKFKPDELPSNRGDISAFSKLNVGVHFIVDKDGTIYSLLPDSIMGRHIIGFNYTAIGIENVAKNKDDLTDEQVKSNATLTSLLVEQHNSIKYLIGHHEYMIEDYDHFELFIEKDVNYKPSIKSDPGDKFMTSLRTLLKDEYNIDLLK